MSARKLTRTSYVHPDSDPPLPRTGDTARTESRRDIEQHTVALAQVHAGALHGWGVATGLDVTATRGGTTLAVTPGVALDVAGHHISLAGGGQARLGSDQLVAVTSTGVTLPLTAPPGIHILTIGWAETFDTDAYATSGFTVFQLDHTPLLAMQPAAGFADNGATIALARVVVAADGTLDDLDRQLRRPVTTPSGQVTLQRPTRTATGAARTIDHRPAGTLTARPDGGLDLTVARPDQEIHLGATGSAALSVTTETLRVRRNDGSTSLHLDPTGRLGIGTTTPGYPLAVAGDIATVGGMIHTGTEAATTTGTVVGAIGFLGFEVQHGQLSFRAGHGFELVDRSGDRPGLAYPRDSHPYADLAIRTLDARGGAAIAGDVAVGGKHALRGNDNWLRLNQDLAFTAGVYTPGVLSSTSLNIGGVNGWADPGWGSVDIASALRVHGSASIAGDLTIAGKPAVRGSGDWLFLNPDGTYASGVYSSRLSSQSLNVGGVSNWSDPGIGNVAVNGNLFVGGTVRLGANDGLVYIGGNQTGRFMALHDDLWFSDPQSGAIEIRNAVNGPGTMVGNFRAFSGLRYKQDVETLDDGALGGLLDDAERTDLVRYRYRGSPDGERRLLGVIAEQCPASIVGEGDLTLNPVEYAAMLHGAIKVLARRLRRVEDDLAGRVEP